MRIDKAIVDAMLNAAKKHGSQAKLAEAMGITPAALSRYVTGRVANINANNWRSIFPVLSSFLPPDYEPAASQFPAEKRSALEQENRELRERVAYLEGRIDAILEFGGVKQAERSREAAEPIPMVEASAPTEIPDDRPLIETPEYLDHEIDRLTAIAESLRRAADPNNCGTISAGEASALYILVSRTIRSMRSKSNWIKEREKRESNVLFLKPLE